MQAREVKKSANLNLAAVHLKTGAWKEARDACNKVCPEKRSSKRSGADVLYCMEAWHV